MERGEEPLARLVASDDRGEQRRAAHGRDVVRGIARAARHHLRRVVLENQHRRLARHAGDASVDELVGNRIADDRDAASGQCVD